MYVWMYLDMYVCMYSDLSQKLKVSSGCTGKANARMYVWMYLDMYVCMYVCTLICHENFKFAQGVHVKQMHACMHVCMYVDM